MSDGETGPANPKPADRQPVESKEQEASSLVSGRQLRTIVLPRSPFGGYRCGYVDRLLEGAAKTLDERTVTIEHLKGQLEESRTREATFAIPEELVGRMLTAAQGVVDGVKEEARQEAERIVAEGRVEAEQATLVRNEAYAAAEAERAQASAILAAARAERERLIVDWEREARAAIEAERSEAAALLAAARAERERLLSDSLVEIAQARDELEAERARLATEINELRGAWAGRLSDALARLDGVDLQVGSAADAPVASVEPTPARGVAPAADAVPAQDTAPDPIAAQTADLTPGSAAAAAADPALALETAPAPAAAPVPVTAPPPVAATNAEQEPAPDDAAPVTSSAVTAAGRLPEPDRTDVLAELEARLPASGEA